MNEESRIKNFYRIAIRIVLLPIALLLLSVPHIIALVINVYRWLRYGGEFIVYTTDDTPSMAKIFYELKKQTHD